VLARSSFRLHNAQRSHAGPVISNCKQRPKPAVADACCWPSCRSCQSMCLAMIRSARDGHDRSSRTSYTSCVTHVEGMSSCSNAKYGEHSLNLAPYEAIQESFVAGLQYNGFLEPFLKAKTDTTIEDKTPELEGKLIELNKSIARLVKAVEVTDNPESIERLGELQAKRKALQADIEAETIRVKGASNGNAAYY
jgi:hypothetical protein